MKTCLKSLLTLVLLSAAADSSLAQGKSSVGNSEYFPLAVNTRWEYVTSKGSRITTQVIKHEEIGNVMCARIEAKLGETKKSSEYVRVGEDGVYRHQASDQLIDPPLRFLALPFKEGTTWKVESKTLGLTVQGTFSMKKGSIKVQGTDYPDVLICNSDDFKIADKNVKQTYWFAKGVGLVKQEVKFGGQTMTLELERYTPGSN